MKLSFEPKGSHPVEGLEYLGPWYLSGDFHNGSIVAHHRFSTEIENQVTELCGSNPQSFVECVGEINLETLATDAFVQQVAEINSVKGELDAYPGIEREGHPPVMFLSSRVRSRYNITSDPAHIDTSFIRKGNGSSKYGIRPHVHTVMMEYAQMASVAVSDYLGNR